MPLIKVFSDPAHGEVGTEGTPGDPAAAVFAAFLANSSLTGGVQVNNGARTKAERTRPRNPNELTIKQHVFPARSIRRFANKKGCVSVYEIPSQKVRSAAPDDIIFCARRAWDQRAESGYMKLIEDEFQSVIDPIVAGQATMVSTNDKVAIDRMFALWYMRSRHRNLETQEIQLLGISGDDLTKAQEENLEKNGYLFCRRGGKIPARQLNGMQLERRIDSYARDLANLQRWGVIYAQSGEFIVPDVPLHTILPLSPRCALIGSSPDGEILEQNLAEINRCMMAASQSYFLAQDLSMCPS